MRPGLNSAIDVVEWEVGGVCLSIKERSLGQEPASPRLASTSEVPDRRGFLLAPLFASPPEAVTTQYGIPNPEEGSEEGFAANGTSLYQLGHERPVPEP